LKKEDWIKDSFILLKLRIFRENGDSFNKVPVSFDSDLSRTYNKTVNYNKKIGWVGIKMQGGRNLLKDIKGWHCKSNDDNPCNNSFFFKFQ